jgi:UDP-N-acetylmuramoyl-tripeptide--D-alanyl-D-alanine ligase
MLNLAHVFSALTAGTNSNQQIARKPISSVVIDSREAQANSLFVAFAGERVDGHNFVAQAFANGAKVALVEREIAGQNMLDLRGGWDGKVPSFPFVIRVENTEHALQEIARHWRGLQKVRVIGITGSVGKTSTKELVYTVLAQRFTTLKSEGNLNNEIGLPLSVLKLTSKHKYAVLEMGTYGLGEIKRLCEIAQPEVGVVTFVGPVHMERMGSIEVIQKAKQELVEELPAFGTAILNYDEPMVKAMSTATPAKVFSYGLTDEADLWADNIESMGIQGVRFDLHHNGTTLRRVHVPLLGRHSVHTCMRAAAVGLVAGLSWDEIITGLQDRRAQLRLVAVDGPHGSLIVDDTYNSSPASALAALNLLAELNGRRLAILGDMLELGEAEAMSHEMVGRRAGDVADVLVTVGVRGRMIAEAALAAGMPSSVIHILPDAASTIQLLNEMIEPNDVILIKGSRGVQLESVVAALSCH